MVSDNGWYVVLSAPEQNTWKVGGGAWRVTLYTQDLGAAIDEAVLVTEAPHRRVSAILRHSRIEPWCGTCPTYVDGRESCRCDQTTILSCMSDATYWGMMAALAEAAGLALDAGHCDLGAPPPPLETSDR